MGSFFADMLVGGISGGAQGYMAQLKQEEEERRYKEQQAEKAALALQLQQQRSEDIRYRDNQDFAIKAERLAMQGERGLGTGGSGSGSTRGGGGSFIENMLRNAKTPEEQNQVMREVALRAPDAAPAVAEYFGRPLQETVSEFDPAEAEKMSRRDYAEANPTAVAEKSVTRNVRHDRNAGAEALNRLIAMADPAKYDDFLKGETQGRLNDNAGVAGKGIKDPLNRAVTEQALMNPAKPMNADLSDEQQAKIRAAAKGAGGGKGADGLTKAEANNRSRDIREAEAALTKASALPVKGLTQTERTRSASEKQSAIAAANVRLERAKAGSGKTAPAATTATGKDRWAAFTRVNPGDPANE